MGFGHGGPLGGTNMIHKILTNESTQEEQWEKPTKMLYCCEDGGSRGPRDAGGTCSGKGEEIVSLGFQKDGLLTT